ncbi:uncharacterized protein ACNS7B_011349 [Menidia menidia]
MKRTVVAVLCLSILLVLFDVSLAVKKGKGGIAGSLNLFKKLPKTKTTLDAKRKESILKKAKQPTQFNRGGYPQQPAGGYPQNPSSPGGYPNQVGYNQYPARPGGYPNQAGYPQYPSRPGGYPNQAGYPQYPGYPAGAFPAQNHPYGGGLGNYGNSPGSYINYNPNNRILSPQYGGSFGYGGHAGGGGSPFSHSVQAMGYAPSDKSRGFGGSAVMAAAGGAVAGMALGYGLGRFPRPHFHFHSPEEELYYNHYMYRKYGARSTDSNDYSRDYELQTPPGTFDNFMDSCLRRTDLLPVGRRKPDDRPAPGPAPGPDPGPAKTTMAASSTTSTEAAPVGGIGSTQAQNSSATPPSTPLSPNRTESNPEPPAASQLLQPDDNAVEDDDDNDTVSIVEIGYPALIRQLKERRCVELYVVYSEKHLKRKIAPAASGWGGVETGHSLSVITSVALVLLGNNVLMLLD